VICADELGPVIPRSFPPAPGWSADGHRVKAPLDYGRGPEKSWVYGALRVGDGQEVTMTAPSPNSIGDQQLLAAVETANPAGTIMVITDNLSSHTSLSTRTWLADHPRIQHTFIPKGACWLNLQEGWWRLFRHQAFAGQSFATPDEITLATWVATCQLNAHARPWVWGRRPPSPRHRHHTFTYRISACDLSSSGMLGRPSTEVGRCGGGLGPSGGPCGPGRLLAGLPGGLLDRRVAGGRPAAAALGPPGGAPCGFRRGRRGAQPYQKSRKPAADPHR
jgi:transposase